MKYARAVCIFIVLIHQIHSFAQQSTYTLYNTEDGLPSEIIYDVKQDKNGYLWICTEGGLVKFNGKTFDKNPLSLIGQKEVIKVFIDSKDRLWFVTLSGEIYYHLDGTTTRLDPSTYSLDKGFIDISEDFQNRLWLTARYGYNITVLDVNELTVVKKLNKDSFGFGPFEFICHFKDRNVVYCVHDVFVLASDNDMEIVRQEKKYNRFFFKPKPLNDSTYFSTRDKEGLITLDLNNIVGTEKYQQFNSYFNRSIQNIFIDDDESIFISTTKGLFILKEQKNGTISFSHILHEYNTGLVLKDKEQNYWVGTKEGLIRLASFDIQFFNKENNGRFMSVATNGEYLFVGTDLNKLLVYDKNLLLVSDEFLSNEEDVIYEIVSDQSDIFLATNKHILKVNAINDFKPKPIYRGFFKSISIDKQNGLWIGGGYYSMKIDRNTREVIKINHTRSYATYPLDSTSVLLGTVNGLTNFNPIEQTNIPLIDGFKEDVRDIEMTSDSTLWLATQNAGIYVVKNNKIIKVLNTESGLNSNICRRMLIHDGYVWLATNKGISKINKETYDVKILSKSIGLPSNEVHDIMHWNGRIFAATSDGLAVLKADKEISFLIPDLNFSSVKIIEKDTIILDKYNLEPSQRNIKIEFDAVSFHNVKDIIFDYKMEGIDNDWIRTKNNYAQYPSLPPGNYNFKVRTKGINSEWSSIKSIEFSLKKYIYEQSWFYLLLGTIAALLIYFFYKQQKQKELDDQNLNNSKLTALRAQMNPHFIFNSLNSLSYFIQNGNKRIANKYVSQFSRLMRLTLNNSDKAYIPLKEELEALMIYVALESLRFDDQLNYIFDVDENIDQTMMGIPPLLVQPYVENAILHGLKPKKGEKELKILIRQLNEKVTIIVEDNGIGRKRSQENKRHNKQIHHSKGMGITANRINLINKSAKKNHSIIIEDNLDKNNLSNGTRVILKLDWINLKLEQNDKMHNS